MIVAASENDRIGKDNKLPWTMPADLKYYKNQTWGMPVVMGRKTYDALGKALPGRKAIVITRNKDLTIHDAVIVASIKDGVDAAAKMGAKEIFIIGGAQIFEKAMPDADRIYLTRIHHSFDGDSYFPKINEKEFELVKENNCKADDKNPYDYSFQVWERIKDV